MNRIVPTRPNDVRGEHDHLRVAALDQDAAERAEQHRRHEEGEDQDRVRRVSEPVVVTTVAISAASTMLLASWLRVCADHR